jgi:hypothetical protein
MEDTVINQDINVFLAQKWQSKQTEYGVSFFQTFIMSEMLKRMIQRHNIT